MVQCQHFMVSIDGSEPAPFSAIGLDNDKDTTWWEFDWGLCTNNLEGKTTKEPFVAAKLI